jgi:hypothetical protein
MESEQSPSDDPKVVTPEAARAALEALAVDRGGLAERVWTPWWYHPSLGLIVAVFVGSPAVRDPAAHSMLVAAGCVGLVFLMLGYKRVTGLSVSSAAGPRSRARIVVVMVAVGVLFVASMVLAATGNEPWVLATTVTVFLVCLIAGRGYDRIYRQELSER